MNTQKIVDNIDPIMEKAIKLKESLKFNPDKEIEKYEILIHLCELMKRADESIANRKEWIENHSHKFPRHAYYHAIHKIDITKRAKKRITDRYIKIKTNAI